MNSASFACLCVNVQFHLLHLLKYMMLMVFSASASQYMRKVHTNFISRAQRSSQQPDKTKCWFNLKKLQQKYITIVQQTSQI